MRFLPSNPARVAAEVLLTVAIVAFVAYDLSGRSSVKPEASNVELSFEAKRPSAAPLAPSSRFEAAAVNGISASNTFGVCGNTVVAANPWVVGGSTNQALEVHLGSGCICNPAISVSNSTTNASGLAGISVQSGSFLSFTDVSSQQSGCGATSGLLQLASGSTLLTGLSSMTPPFPAGLFPFCLKENNLPQSPLSLSQRKRLGHVLLTPLFASSGQVFNPNANLVYPLLLASGACPTFVGVTIPATTNCPNTGVLRALPPPPPCPPLCLPLLPFSHLLI